MRAIIIVVFLLLEATTQRLPAPIQETTETPTPAPEQSAKPKPKRTTNVKAATETSKSSEKRQATSSQPKSHSKSIESQFSGTWNGIINCGIIGGDIEHTIVIDMAHSVMTVWQTRNPSARGSGVPEINGDTVAFHNGIYGTWLLTPLPNGQSARVRLQGALFGGTAIFRRVSQ
jgi:hypothetical protein